MEEEPSFEELLEQLNHDDWKVRKQEIDKIRKFKDVDSYFALRKLLNDENEDVRRSASKVFLNEEIFSKLLNIERKLMSSYNRFSEGYYNKQDDTGYCDSIEEINDSIEKYGKDVIEIIRVHYQTPEKSLFDVGKIHSSLPEFLNKLEKKD